MFDGTQASAPTNGNHFFIPEFWFWPVKMCIDGGRNNLGMAV